MFMHLTGARGADFPGVGVHWCATANGLTGQYYSQAKDRGAVGRGGACSFLRRS